MPLDIVERVTIAEEPRRKLALVADRTPGDAFVELLGQTAFGSAGLRYRRLGLRDQLARLPDPVFLELRRAGDLVGTYALAGTPLRIGDQQADGFYRGLLAVRPTEAGRGFGRFIVNETRRWLEHEARKHARPVVTWGCIEQGNSRSLELLERRGAERFGQLESLLVYRQFPRESLAVRRLDERVDQRVAEALNEARGDCVTRYAATPDAPFYAATDAGGIVAGARVVPVRIDLSPSAGRWAGIYSAIVRPLPPARRRFDPRDLRYLRLSDIVVRPGSESAWKRFLPTLLALHGGHMAMFIVDPASRVASRLRRAGLLGHFAEATRQQITILGDTWNLAPQQQQELRSGPTAIGPLDL